LLGAWLTAVLLSAAGARADEPSKGSDPTPVPLTRKDMKQALENSKQVTPRLPIPPVTEEEKARAAEAAKAREGAEGKTGRGSGLGSGIVNNGRMRNFYLSDYNVRPSGGDGRARPGGGLGVGFSRENEPGQSLGYPFQTQLFWIASRANNCTYCMGHQEAKLASAGLSDDEIAALDGEWLELDPAKRAAFAFTKKLTHEPHAITDADIAALREHYNDNQMTEIILAVGNFNAMNRWTGPLRITQEDRHEFLKPTSAKYASVISRVAPIAENATGSGFVAPGPKRRAPLESRAAVEEAIEAAKHRTPRLVLADASATKALLNGSAGDNPPQWMRFLAVFPRSGAWRITTHIAAQEKGTLDARTKAIIAWVAARNDRAWYALDQARRSLRTLGFSDDQIFALDQPESLESAADREVVKFATKITVNPALADDDDFARLRKLFDDKKVAEIVYQITEAAFFDRVTEAAGLAVEP
jgi:alkylhydroperoxidase family enzyme